MKRVFVLSFSLFLLSVCSVRAGLMEVSKEGDIIWSVLSYEDSLLTPPVQNEIKVEKIAKKTALNTDTISLKKNAEQVIIEVEEDNEKKSLELTNWQESLVEISERSEFEKIAIKSEDNEFVIEQKNVKAITEFPIKIDAKSAQISIVTKTGDKYLFILPLEAVQTAIRSHTIDSLTQKDILLQEKDENLVYKIQGERRIPIFNFYTHKEPVEVLISSVNGEIVSDTTPAWLKVLNVLFG